LGLPDLSSYASSLLLGQTAAPALPGTPAAAIPDLGALNPQYLVPLNQDPAAPGQGALAPGIGPNEDIPGAGRISLLRRLYEMHQAGDLRGGLLGQVPPEEFYEQLVPAPNSCSRSPRPRCWAVSASSEVRFRRCESMGVRLPSPVIFCSR
jgi:hypothetical protein